MTRPGWTCPGASRAMAYASRYLGPGGSPQIWIGDCEGPGLRSLTIPTGGAINVGSWSPHGTHVAFDMVVDGNTDIDTIGIDGGRPPG